MSQVSLGASPSPISITSSLQGHPTLSPLVPTLHLAIRPGETQVRWLYPTCPQEDVWVLSRPHCQDISSVSPMLCPRVKVTLLTSPGEPRGRQDSQPTVFLDQSFQEQQGSGRERHSLFSCLLTCLIQSRRKPQHSPTSSPFSLSPSPSLQQESKLRAPTSGRQVHPAPIEKQCLF